MTPETTSLFRHIARAKAEPLLPDLIVTGMALGSIVFGSIVAVRFMDSALDLLVR